MHWKYVWKLYSWIGWLKDAKVGTSISITASVPVCYWGNWIQLSSKLSGSEYTNKYSKFKWEVPVTEICQHIYGSSINITTNLM